MLLSIVCFILVVIFISLVKNNNEKNLNDVNGNYNSKIKSANLSVDYEIDQVIKDIELLDLNTVNVPIVINIENLTSSNFYIDKNSKIKAKKLIKKLKKKNIKVILEAYPWIDNGQKYETEWNPSNKKEFFENWKYRVIKTLVKDIANPLDVEIMNIASNLVYVESYEDEWCDIINYVKTTFKGEVTYRTSWWYTSQSMPKSYEEYNNKLKNKIFDQVDFISIAAYFELSKKSTNSADDLVNALSESTVFDRKQNIKEEIYNLYKAHNKQILFGELGFARRQNASSQPWNPEPSNIKDDKEQARCFDAYKKVFENEEWIRGFSIFCVGKIDEFKNYYPSKQSIEVIKSWYK